MRKLLSTAVAAGLIASTTLMPLAYADVSATALPTLDTAKNATVSTDKAKMNIQIQGGQGGVGTLNWKTYNIGKDAHVNYEFTAHNQTALNKVSASGGLSQIYGKITDSGCYNCGYAGTGKIVLLNPNGVLFGDGANVDVNSFTVTTMNGVFDKDTNKLQLTKDSNQKDFGIVVTDGANIYGDKNVTFASKNITVYNGSKISTNVGNNVEDTAYGKVKLVTADGVNFEYYNNGAVKEISGITNSADKMLLSVNGDIQSGNIDMRNYSTHNDSEINLNGATLKATKAVKGNDGNIWLTAMNKIVDEDSKVTTVNMSGAESRNGGNVLFLAGKKVSVGTNDIDAVGNVNLTSQGHDVVLDHSTVDTAKDVTLQAGRVASIQNNSVVNANNVTVNGNSIGQISNSKVKAANDINVISAGELAWTDKADLEAGHDINVTATNGYLLLNDTVMNAKNNVNLTSKDTIATDNLTGSTFKADKNVALESTAESIILTDLTQFQPKGTLDLKAAKNVEDNYANDLTTEKTNITAGKNVFLTSKEGNVTVKDTTKFLAAEKIYIQGAKDVKTSGTVDMNNIQTNIKAGNDVDVTLKNVGNRQNGLVAEAGRNMKVTTPGTLSVSSLISANDMEINANKVIAGLPYTDKQKLPGDPNTERSYIEVGGEFTSNVTNNNYVLTESGELTPDGNYNKKHHIEYGANGEEKILLVNKRPVENNVTDPTIPDNDNGDELDVVRPGSRPTTPGTTEPTNPGTDPGTNPGTDPGTNPGTDPGTNPGDNPGDDQDCDSPSDGDTARDEDAPILFSATNYAASATSNRN